MGLSLSLLLEYVVFGFGCGVDGCCVVVFGSGCCVWLALFCVPYGLP